MKKLDKSTILQRDKLAVRFSDQYSVLEKSANAFNAALSAALDEHWGPLEEAVEAYNAVIADANAWKGEISEEIEDYIGGRSEKWQESDKAREYEQWKAEFQDDFEQIEMPEKPQELELMNDLENHEELLGNLPETVNGEI